MNRMLGLWKSQIGTSELSSFRLKSWYELYTWTLLSVLIRHVAEVNPQILEINIDPHLDLREFVINTFDVQ